LTLKQIGARLGRSGRDIPKLLRAPRRPGDEA
jgi:hypothetical protein